MYVDDQWKSPNITELLILLLELWVDNQKTALSSLNAMSQSHTTDKDDIKYHYDMGNDFYMTFLIDDLHAYSCGFFFCETDDLNRAQYNKVHEVIRKLEVKPGDRVLDVGCGWGSIANYVATKTKATVHGITLSDEQEKYSLKHYPDIYVKNISYVDMSIDVRYDKIYSIGMFEHVRCENYNLFFNKMFDLLEPNGRMVLHTITHGMKPNNSTCAYQNEVYVTKHIFPGGQIPNIEWITKAASAAGFRLTHMESYGGQHYAKTLRTWRSYMMAKKEYILSLGYTAEQIRSYEYYMAGCEANFLNDGMCITHFVLTKNNILEHVGFQCKA